MSHYDSSSLAAYNSLADPHLQSYFSSERIQSHLKNAGLINQRGEIVTEGEYRSRLAQREHRKYVRHMLAENIVHRAVDMERARLAEIRRQHEILAKAANVNNIKESRRRNATYTPFMSNSTDFTALTFDSRPRSANFQGNSDNDERINRNPRFPSASNQRHPDGNDDDDNDDDDDDDGNVGPTRKNPLNRRMNRRQSAQRGKSLHRSKSKKKSIDSSMNSSPCQITMVYLGPHMKVDFDHLVFEDLDEVLVMQQHCGGENLSVFKGFLKAGDEFTFNSRRRTDYPFGLTLYVKGLFDSRISTCCEHKHRHGVRLGGDRGHFAIKSVQGSKPCLKCRFEKEAMLKKMSESPKTKNEENSTSITIPLSTIEKPNQRRSIVQIPLHSPDRHTSVSSSKNEDYQNDFEQIEATRMERRLSDRTASSQSERSEKKTKKKSSIDSIRSKGRKSTDFHSNDEKEFSQLLIFPSDESIDSQLKNFFLNILLINGDHETIEEKINLRSLIKNFDENLKIEFKHSFEPTKIQLKLSPHDDDDDEEIEKIKWKIDLIEFVDEKKKILRRFRSKNPIETQQFVTFVREEKVDSKDEKVHCQMILYPSDHRNDDQLKNYFLRIVLIDTDGGTIEEKVNLKTLIDRSDSFFKFNLHHSAEPTKVQLKLLPHDEDEDEELRWKIERIEFLDKTKETVVKFRSTDLVETQKLVTFVREEEKEKSVRSSRSSRSTSERPSSRRSIRSDRNEKNRFQIEIFSSNRFEAKKFNFYIRFNENDEEIRLTLSEEEENFEISTREDFDQIQCLTIGFFDEYRPKIEKIILKNVEKNIEKVFSPTEESKTSKEMKFSLQDENQETPRASPRKDSFPELNDNEAHYRPIFRRLDPKNELSLGSEPTSPTERIDSTRKSPPVDPLPNLEDLQQQNSSRSNLQQEKPKKSFTQMYSNEDEDEDDFH